MQPLKTLLLLTACLALATVASAGRRCFDSPSRMRRNIFRNDKWLRKYKPVRVITSNFYYLPSFLAASGEKYGAVTGNSTVKILSGNSCAPYAMSASGVFHLENPPTEFLQGDRRFSSHLHEGTCDEIGTDGKSKNGLGNHYQHLPLCPTYSSTPSAGSAGYADTMFCKNADAPGGKRRGRPPFEMWPTYFGVEGDSKTFKVGSLQEQADDLVDCPTPCKGQRCTDCQTRSVPWWPAPGVPVSIAVHDTASVESGAGPIMLCAEVTGFATEEASCTAAGLEYCRPTSEEDLKSSRFCLYSISPFLPAGDQSPC